MKSPILNSTPGSRCVKRTKQPLFLILFIQPDATTGFQFAHICEVAFHPAPIATESPPHQITVQFLTHTVTLNGWNLAEVAVQLANGKIGSLQALPPPVSPPPVKPWISEIKITAISDIKPATNQL
jgi:hypothetical protein